MHLIKENSIQSYNTIFKYIFDMLYRLTDFKIFATGIFKMVSPILYTKN